MVLDIYRTKLDVKQMEIIIQRKKRQAIYSSLSTTGIFYFQQESDFFNCHFLIMSKPFEIPNKTFTFYLNPGYFR